MIAKIMAVARIRTLLGTTSVGVLPWKNLAGILVAAGIAAIPSLLLNANLELSSLVLLPLSGITYLVTYSTMVLLLGLLTADEKAAIKRTLAIWNRLPAIGVITSGETRS
jgi:hypothetical protein